MNTPVMLKPGCTCTIAKNGRVIFTSKANGIRPLLEVLETGLDIADGTAADKIVGKAAALLYVQMRVAEVQAEVLSQSGLAVLQAHGIRVSYRTLTAQIINRQGTGPCPMEQTVAAIDDPAEAFTALREKAAQLRAKQK